MINRSKYREYKLEQNIESGNLDSAFDYFVESDDTELIEDEFISNVKISGDYHDMMLKEDIEIAFQSAEIELALIPNYETLEVMLVERGLTYDAIRVQTNIDDFIYNNLYSLDDRSEEYSNVIRFKSGYRPAFPFVRDPGDHIRNLRSTSGRYYNEIVYQKQIWQEKLRAQYEGNIIVLNNRSYDNAIESIRMMIYGEWRAVAFKGSWGGAYPAIKTLVYYDQINGLGLDYNPDAKPWEDNSVLNVMIDEGVITDLQGDGKDGEPIWNDFNHYSWRDSADGVNLDGSGNRYQRYIDTTNNEVFNLEYMQPYEPEGSELYYNEYGGWQEIQ
jgi:hypothetical protein